MTAHEYTALRLLDYGFNLPEYHDVWPKALTHGWVEDRAGVLHVTSRGRRAYRGWPHA